MIIKSISIEFVQEQQVGLKVNSITGDIMEWQNSKDFPVVIIRIGLQTRWLAAR